MCFFFSTRRKRRDFCGDVVDVMGGEKDTQRVDHVKIKTEEKSSDGIILSRNRLVGSTTGE